MHFASTGALSIRDVAASPDGRVAIGGYYQGHLLGVAGSGKDENVLQLRDADSDDGFVAVLPHGDQPHWAQPIPGFGAQGITGVAFAPNRDLAVQGFSDQRRDAAAGLGSDSALVARFEVKGDVNLRKGYAGNQTFAGRVATDRDAATILVGSFTGQFDFYGLQQISPPYVVKLDRDGGVAWIRDLGTNWGSYAPPSGVDLENLSVAVDANDAVLIAGDVNGDGHYGFLAKLSAAGKLEYFKQFSGAGVVHTYGVASDDDGSVLVVGAASGAWSLDGVEVAAVADATGFNAWLAKFSETGEQQWLRIFPSQDRGNGALASAVAIDRHRNIVIAGTASSVQIGDAMLAPQAASADAVFVAKLGPEGDKLWTYATDAEAATVFGVAIDAHGDVWACGELATSFVFDGRLTQASGSSDGFLLHLAP